jgi:hypothetical protein
LHGIASFPPVREHKQGEVKISSVEVERKREGEERNGRERTGMEEKGESERTIQKVKKRCKTRGGRSRREEVVVRTGWWFGHFLERPPVAVFFEFLVSFLDCATLFDHPKQCVTVKETSSTMCHSQGNFVAQPEHQVKRSYSRNP